VQMPRVNSLDIGEQIRQISGRPIIITAGHAQLRECVTALQLGANDYLIKPFESSEVLVRVARTLYNNGAGDTLRSRAELKLDGITIDPVHHRAFVNDSNAVELTPIEVRVLYCLMKNANHTVGCDQILREVWGHNDRSANKTLATCIHRLRTKIERDTRHPQYIITVRNKGYKFAC
jgi:DNA-binding response OmpR family regulator